MTSSFQVNVTVSKPQDATLAVKLTLSTKQALLFYHGLKKNFRNYKPSYFEIQDIFFAVYMLFYLFSESFID
jgi:hypothetical protein